MIEEIGQGEFKGFPQNLIFGVFFKAILPRVFFFY